jgi:hypothetical protein
MWVVNRELEHCLEEAGVVANGFIANEEIIK